MGSPRLPATTTTDEVREAGPETATTTTWPEVAERPLPLRRRAALRFLPALGGLALILLVWQFGVQALGIPTYLLPKPSNIAAAIGERRAELLEAVVRTLVSSLSGLALAIVLGVAAAVVLGFSSLLERSVFPYAIVLQTTPVVAIAPLVVIWIGPGLRAIIVISLIISFFPMLSNTLAGLNSVDPEHRNLFRLYGASRWETMWKLRLPGAMPYIVAGVRISGGLSVIGAIVGEFVAGIGGGRGGLGYIVVVSAKQFNTPYLAAGALAGAVLGVTYHLAGRRLARRLLSWHESVAGQEGDGRAQGDVVPTGAA